MRPCRTRHMKQRANFSIKAGATAADVYQSNEFAGKRVSSCVALATSIRVLEAVTQELELSGGAPALKDKVTGLLPTLTYNRLSGLQLRPQSNSLRR